MSLPIRTKFSSEIQSIIDKEAEIITTQGKKYVGKITVIDPENFNIILNEAKDESGNVYSMIILHGVIVAEIKLLSRHIDLKSLAEKLEKFFPRLVSYDEVSKVITVADKVRILPNGTVEGVGPIADKVRAICSDFFKTS
ncbi:MAG: Lsm family RNA-binding protein [Thermoproteota archaeon]|nr:Lsm family RNA-binding protein [Thermoproteota archaeon]